MTTRDFYNTLMAVTTVRDVDDAVHMFVDHFSDRIAYEPVGRPNNKGHIEVATDAGRSAMERVTNAQDAVLDLEHARHNGLPVCRSPREAASAWLGVPQEGLSELTPTERRDLAKRITVRLLNGEDKHSRLLEVIDQGVGIRPQDLSRTILSLGESNKIQKHYLAGVYGQGGSSTFAFSRFTVIASRHSESNQIGFTVISYLDLPADQYKTGQYVYMVLDKEPLTVPAEAKDIKYGTIVRHFGYDLSSYSSSIGPSSLYGALNRILFDPVTPVWFENKVNGWNRVIKGSRNALHGAVDEGDDAKTKLDHSIPLFNVNLGDLGYLGIEYWVLEKPDKNTSKPSAVFIDPRKPIVLTFNGQNQGELPSSVIRKDADLPFLKDRLIAHINCDRLSHEAKRNLFSSTREQSKKGFVLERITQEIRHVLKTDDELKRLNDLAKNESLKDTDEDAKQQIKKEVAKLLRISGAAVIEAGGKKTKEEGQTEGKPVTPKKHKPLEPLPINEPPTYIRIVWEEEKDIKFYPSQRRYIRIETDANSEYHDPMSPGASRINIIAGDDLKLFGTTPLKGGRMRAGIDCIEGAKIENAGKITVELYRTGLVALGDSRDYLIVEKPLPKDTDKEATFPDFRVIEVTGPEDENWDKLSEDENVATVASNSLMNAGTLLVYYSSVFPKFSEELSKFAVKDPVLALSFKLRYEIWIAFHSLLMYQDQTQNDKAQVEIDEALQEGVDRKERCRLAQIASVMAGREVRMGFQKEEQEEG